MADKKRRDIVYVEVSEETKHWLLRKSVERQLRGLKQGERSMSAVIRDLIDAARRNEQAAA